MLHQCIARRIVEVVGVAKPTAQLQRDAKKLRETQIN
jgi:hypothetical protein